MTGPAADRTVRAFAPAKINLLLHVTGKRADGYHLLDSLVVFAGVGDDLTFAPGEGLSLSITGPNAAGLSADNDNLVLRAARLLADWAGRRPHAAIRLTKRLPVSSGIGGGSANAAATLRGLCELWNLAPSQQELNAIGLQLGADLPVCLAGVPARMTGIGEQITPLPALPTAWLVLANPRIAVPTPAVFKARQGAFSAPAELAPFPTDFPGLTQLLAQHHNDLMPPAIALAPAIAQVNAALAAQPGCALARMSGSGATCWGLFPNQFSAQKAALSLQSAHPDWWVAAADILPPF